MEKNLGILMADLAGYTALTDVHGGVSAARIVAKYMELVHNSLCGESRLMQRIGDQVVIVSDHALDLAVTAQNLINAALEERHFLSIHTGIHYDPVHQEDGNLFGSTINVASRIMNMAQQGQILCSSTFVSAIPTQSACVFREIGSFKFKNVLKEVQVLELVKNTDASSCFHVDPVCHMLVDPAKENHTHLHENQSYYFCSEDCLALFRTDPKSFIHH